MKEFRLCLSLLLCFCLCTAMFGLCALAEGSAESVESGTPLSPVEQVFQVIALLVLFGGIAMLPVYYLLNKRRRRIIASFEEKKEADDTSNDETNE